MKYEIQKEFKAVLITKIYSHKDSMNNSLICFSIHSNFIKFTCSMLNMIITIITIIFFSARDEFKIKYEQLERDVLMLNERVWCICA